MPPTRRSSRNRPGGERPYGMPVPFTNKQFKEKMKQAQESGNKKLLRQLRDLQSANRNPNEDAEQEDREMEKESEENQDAEGYEQSSDDAQDGAQEESTSQMEQEHETSSSTISRPTYCEVLGVSLSPPSQRPPLSPTTPTKSATSISTSTPVSPNLNSDPYDTRLPMIHYRDILPSRWNNFNGRYVHFPFPAYLDFENPVYRFGGMVYRINVEEHRKVPKHIDVMVCNTVVCPVCNSTVTEQPDPVLSPTAGLPFVHVKRDLVITRTEYKKKERVFRQEEKVLGYSTDVDAVVSRTTQVVNFGCGTRVLCATCNVDQCEICAEVSR